MPDATPLEVKKTITPSEALYYTKTSESPAGMDFSNQEVKEAAEDAQKRAKELYAVKSKAEKDPGRAAIDAARERLNPEQKFGKTEADELLSTLGGGMTMRDNGEIIADPSKQPDQTRKDILEARFKTEKKAVREIQNFVKYSDIVLAETTTGRTQSEILSSQDPPMNGNEYRALRKESLETLLHNGVLRDLLPELQDIQDDTEKMDLLEDTLIKDPRLQRIILERMKTMRQQANEMKPVSIDVDIQDATELKRQAKARYEQGQGALADWLQVSGLPKKEATDLAMKIIEQGVGVDSGAALGLITARVQSQIGADTLNYIRQYRDLAVRAEAARIQADKDVANYKPAVSKGGGGMTPEQIKAQNESIRAGAVDLETQLRNFATDRFPGDQDKVDSFNQSLAQYNNFIDGRESMAAIIKDAQEGKKIAIDLNPALAQAEERKRASEVSFDQRMKDEALYTRQLENLLANAVVDLLDERKVEMTKAQKLREEKEQTDLEKSGKTPEAIALKNYMKNQDEKRIHYDKDKRKLVKDANIKDSVKEDMVTAMYQGDEGVKRMIIRDMEIPLPKDEAGKEYTYDTVPLDLLTKEQKELIDGKVNDYKERLLSDFYSLRNISDRLGFGKLRLEDHEWQLLDKNFKSVYDAAIAKDPALREKMKQFEAKGLLKDPKVKWLLFILSLGLTAAGVALTAGTLGIPALIAAGAAGAGLSLPSLGAIPVGAIEGAGITAGGTVGSVIAGKGLQGNK